MEKAEKLMFQNNKKLRVSGATRNRIFIFEGQMTDLSKLWTAVYPPRIAPFGLKLWENAFRMIPNISFFEAKSVKILYFFRKLWTAVYPPRIAPIGLKLGQNAFQTIPDISFFDPRNFFQLNIFVQKCVFWSKKTSATFGGIKANVPGYIRFWFGFERFLGRLS